MRVFLLFLCILWVSSDRSFFDGVCPRKDPPPDVVVLYLGNRLDLTCRGDVKVNGIRVKHGSNPNKRRTLVGISSTPRAATNSAFSTKSDKTSAQNRASEEYHFSTTTGISAVSGKNKNLSYTHMEYTSSPYTAQSTTTSTTTDRVSDSEDEEMDTEDDYDNEEGVEKNKITKGINLSSQWKWDKKLVGKGDRDWGEIIFSSGGATLSLTSVRLTDTGKYTCHFNGREIFAVKVIIVEHPEIPSLSCYKKSPSSKIRCEWRPQKPVIKQPNCHLVLSKSSPKFHQIPCSYSSNLSHCWCAIDNNDDEQRTVYTVILCATSILGNATSSPIYFTPLSILKPDPPSNVSVQLEQGPKMKVTWNLPLSWKKQDSFYGITYELRYRPSKSSYEQMIEIKGKCSFTITDVLPGAEYLIELRNREEYDGHWSEWSSPVYVTSWTESPPDNQISEMIDSNSLELGSGFPTAYSIYDPTTDPVCLNSPCEPPHALWTVAVFAVLSIVLAVYIFRNKSKLLSKLHSFSVIAPHQELFPPPPPVSGPPEGETLVIFVPQSYKDYLPTDTEEEEENEKGQTTTDVIEAMHFNNKSYFFLK